MPSTPVPVQAVSVESAGQVSALTSPSFTSTVGNLLVVAAVANCASSNWGGLGYSMVPGDIITDNHNLTWQVGQDAGASGASSVQNCILFYASISSGGSGHTVSLASSLATSYLSIAVEEISGASAAYPLDMGNDSSWVGTGLSSNPHSTAGSMSPSVTNTLVVSASTNGGSNNNVASGTGTAVIRAHQDGTTNQPVALATDARSTTAAVTPGFTFAPNDSMGVTIAAMSVKPDSGLPQSTGATTFRGADTTIAQPNAS